MASTVVYRSRSNQIAAWLLGVGLLAGAVAVDPLHLYMTWSDTPRDEAWYVQLPSYLFFWIFAQSAFAVFGRPRIEITDSHVILRNVFRDVVIPKGAIQAAQSDGKYLVVTAGGRRYRAAGTESANIQTYGGVSARAAALVHEALDAEELPEPSDGPVRVAWRRLDLTEWSLGVAWLTYPVLACLADLLGWQPA
jgi:hypothetical protein